MTNERDFSTKRRFEHAGTITIGVFLTAICGGLSLAGYTAWKSIGNQFAIPGNITATVQPAPLMAEPTGTQEPTATETPLPLPTLDDRYIKQQAELARIAQDEASAKQVLANAQSTAIANLVTEAAVQAGTPTMQAIIEGTRQAVQTQRAIIGMTETPAAQQAVMFAQQVEKQDKQDTAAANIRLTWNIAGAVVLVIAAAVIGYGVQLGLNNAAQKTYYEREAGNSSPVEGSDEFLKNMIPATQVTNSEGTAVFEHTSNITREEWFTIRRAAVALGGIFSRRTLTGEYGGEKYFTDSRAREIINILQKYDADDNHYGQPHTNDTTLLTECGWKWLKLSPTSPPSDVISPNSDENTAKNNPTPPQNAEGETLKGEVILPAEPWKPLQHTRNGKSK